jgi:glutaminyl-peptide cyclotransferase
MANALIALALGLQSLVPVAKFDAGRAWEHLRQMVAIGPRPSGSPAIEQTRKYIKEQLAANGLIASEQAWDDQTPLDKVHMVNLVVTIPGARKERIVIAGHYDTKLYRQFRFVGASDGGSSAAFLLDLARVL